MNLPKVDGRRLRWQQHNEQRRQRVIEAAIKVLEEQWPAAEVRVQQIAQEAGINRSVIYRYFDDRSDLDVAVQEEICRQASDALVPAVSPDGTIREIVERVVGAYVTWAAAHPALIRFAEQEIAGASSRPLEQTIEFLAALIEQVIISIVDALEGELPETDRAALEPWVFALIGGGMAAVRRWSSRPTLDPAPETFAGLVSDSIWFQVAGLADDRGITLPDRPVEEIVETTTAGG